MPRPSTIPGGDYVPEWQALTWVVVALAVGFVLHGLLGNNHDARLRHLEGKQQGVDGWIDKTETKLREELGPLAEGQRQFGKLLRDHELQIDELKRNR